MKEPFSLNRTGDKMRKSHKPQQNSTISPVQVVALEALLAGRSVTDAATVAGVDRTTVHLWLKGDFAFRAALNRGRRELLDRMEARLVNLADKAAGVVEAAIAKGDERVALAVLKGLGLLEGTRPTIGSDDPRDLENADRQTEHYRLLGI